MSDSRQSGRLRSQWLLVLLVCAADLGWAALPVAEIEPSVVRVVTRTSGGVATGTGFVLNDSGYVATNNHVVSGGERFQVIPSNSSSPMSAELVWSSGDVDLAILQVRGLLRPPAKLASVLPKKGEPVFALGFPGLADRLGDATDASVTGGILSRVFRASWGSGSTIALLQHTADINPGNSGGPLFDGCGRVIGVNTQGSGAGRITRDSSGRVIDIMAGSGVFFASQIAVLTRQLSSRNIAFSEVSSSCNPATAISGPIEDQEAREKAQAAGSQARRAESSAQKASAAAAKAQEDAFAAAGIAEQAGKAAESAATAASTAGSEITRLGRNFVRWGVILFILTAAALGLALRRPRERIIEMAQQYSRAISREVSGVFQGARRRRSSKDPPHGLALSGITATGQPVRLHLASEAFSSAEKGLVVGRHPMLCDALLDDSQVSRRHCRLRWHGKAWQVQDLNSENGTALGQHRLMPYQWTDLNEGDAISLGTVNCVVSKSR